MPENERENALPPAMPNVAEAQALTEMKKENDTLKAEIADLREAKTRYYDSVINSNPAEEAAPKERTVKEIRDDLVKGIDKGITNLEYASLALELNDACIREDGQSCFLPKGRDVQVSADEVMISQKFPKIIKECIDTAQGDPEIFDNELKRRIKRK